MKDFLKYVLATIVGIILTSIIFVVISIVSLAGMLASEGRTAFSASSCRARLWTGQARPLLWSSSAGANR